MRNALISACLLASTTACSSGTPTAPQAPAINVSGTWSGAVTVETTQARMTWTLAQDAANGVTGPVLVTLSNGSVLMNGTLAGTLSGSNLTYTVAIGAGGIPALPACTGQLSGTMTTTIGAVSTLAGPVNVSSSNCAPPFSTQTITLTKQ